MMEWIRANQLDVMLYMSGCCGILAAMTLIPRFMSRRRKSILALMELSSMCLLLVDRAAYLYRGDRSELGFVMVRVSNGLDYFLILLIPLLATRFMADLYRNEGGMAKPPKRLTACEALFALGTLLLIFSQFTGLYYTFDAQNRYQRAPGNFVSYIVPFLVVVLQESAILQYRDRLKRGLVAALAVSVALPTVASVIQFLCYGLSLTSITMVFVVIVFYVYALSALAEEVELARKHEVEFYKEARRREAALFEETTEALANAIDAKDAYTRGHSARVAALSRQLAREAGYADEDCDRVYFTALLHDVGKIGVRDTVINKPGKLTDEEFAEMKRHPELGYQILSSIRQSPYLSVGAHYHHERFDGTGYPDGLAGEDIPELARIIAVADAYDAMTSNRSYRGALPMQAVRDEIANGAGKQFDPRFADILLRLMEQGKTAI